MRAAGRSFKPSLTDLAFASSSFLARQGLTLIVLQGRSFWNLRLGLSVGNLIHWCTYAYIYVYSMCMYIYIHTYIHTYICMHFLFHVWGSVHVYILVCVHFFSYLLIHYCLFDFLFLWCACLIVSIFIVLGLYKMCRPIICVYDCLCVGLSETKMYTVTYSCLFIIWSFNIAMENHHV